MVIETKKWTIVITIKFLDIRSRTMTKQFRSRVQANEARQTLFLTAGRARYCVIAAAANKNAAAERC